MSQKKILYRVINCSIHEKRLKKFRSKAASSGLPHVTRVSCINGKKFTDRKFCSMIEDGILNYKAELSPTEVAICLSHAKCWKQLMNSKAEYMLVFEDDCQPYKSFMKNFNAFMDADLDFDIFWLYNGNWMRNKNSEKKITTVDKIPIYRETEDYNASGSCYLITKKWAKVLYNKMFPIIYPVDNFMDLLGLKQHDIIQYKIKNVRVPVLTVSLLAPLCMSRVQENQLVHKHITQLKLLIES